MRFRVELLGDLLVDDDGGLEDHAVDEDFYDLLGALFPLL